MHAVSSSGLLRARLDVLARVEHVSIPLSSCMWGLYSVLWWNLQSLTIFLDPPNRMSGYL